MTTVAWLPVSPGSNFSWSQERDFEAEHVGDWFDLFNGQDLGGWEQKSGSAKYKVVDGSVEGTTSDGSSSSLLRTRRDFADFELKFEVKVNNALNSTVQVRSSAFENSRTDPEITNAFKNDDWNQYRILAIGDRIQTWVNGVQVADRVGKESAKTGFIGLTVHSDPAAKAPHKVAWKNIRIRELNVELAHSFIGFGKANQVTIFSETGAVEWSLPLPASDGWALENGNILIAVYPCKKYRKGAVIEVERESKEIVCEYQGRQKEISTAQKISSDQYLITELGAQPKAIVVSKDGTLIDEMALSCQKKRVHMQTRMLRMLPNGNYIAPHLLDFAVKEYDPKTGKVVREFLTDDRGRDRKDWPFTAIRLKNGNTVIGCTVGNRVIEIDEQGKIVWSVTNGDLGEKLIADACGVQRLPNGNTIISSYRAKGDSVKLFEVTPDKKVVWRFSGKKAGFHHFQILSTNGRSLSAAYR